MNKNKYEEALEIAMDNCNAFGKEQYKLLKEAVELAARYKVLMYNKEKFYEAMIPGEIAKNNNLVQENKILKDGIKSIVKSCNKVFYINDSVIVLNGFINDIHEYNAIKDMLEVIGYER